ncbi:uncharacterized protein LOC143857509 isoform X2 [Tasmannia lanceolata]|uniref:uncharacterized protein LOC143857509 isoform X2 n=1 Tax=Tasmannia lanceolata TaxID=3420 RepID=UPI0040634F7B
MATDMDRAYCEWSHDDMSGRDNSPKASVSQIILDPGSISFGRFSVESLSWERWSVFSHNRCQEELEKFKSPGLVAQKKAYFEEYYKKIRALKALQESQTCEEEQNSMEDESTRIGLSNHISPSEENGIFDGTISSQTCEEQNNMEHESTRIGLSNHISPSNDENIEELELHKYEFTKLNDERITSKDECSMTTDEFKVAGPKAASQETATELIVFATQRESEIIQENSMVAEAKASAQETATELIVFATQRDSEIIQENSMVLDRLKQNIKKCKDNTSVIMAKGAAAPSVRSNVKSKGSTKSDTVKSSQVLKHTPRKANPLAENTNNSRKATISMVSSNNKSASFSSHRQGRSNVTVPRPFSFSTEQRAPNPVSIRYSGSGTTVNNINTCKATTNSISRNEKSSSISSNRTHKELHSNVTVPRPYSLSTERRTTPVSVRNDALLPSNSKASNRSAKMPLHGKSMSCVQSTSMEIFGTGGKKSTAFEKRRIHEEFGRKSMVLDSHRTIPMQNDSDICRRKVMSTNFPSKSKSNQKGGIEFQRRSIDSGAKWKEGKEDTQSKELRPSQKLYRGGMATMERKKVPWI